MRNAILAAGTLLTVAGSMAVLPQAQQPAPGAGSGVANKSEVREVIETRWMDPAAVQWIPTETVMTTTVSFPHPIESIDGAGFAADPGQSGAKFNISFTPGSSRLSIHPIREGVRGNLNVVVSDQVYVLLFTEQAGKGVFSVNFAEKRTPSSRPKKRNILVSPARLIGLLDKCKGYPILVQQHPEAVDDIEWAAPNRTTDHGDWSIVLKNVYRKDEWDTLVFEVELVNKTDKPIYYNPEGWTVRVHDYVYYQSVGDSNGVMAPQSRTPAWFAITGDQTGGTNDLALENEFEVAVETVTGVANAASSNPLKAFQK